MRSLHIEEGHPDPPVDCLQLQRLLRGIKRCQGSKQVKRCPVTGKLMHIIHHSLDVSNVFNHVMLLAACCLGFFGFFHKFDPNYHLTMQDIQVDSMVAPSSIKVHVKSLKTDPFRQGCYIYIGKGRSTLCPIVAIIKYLNLRGPSSGPLFVNQDGSPLTRQALSTTIQSILQAAGVPGQFSGHSCWIGAATTAAGQGVQDHLINVLGRW